MEVKSPGFVDIINKDGHLLSEITAILFKNYCYFFGNYCYSFQTFRKVFFSVGVVIFVIHILRTLAEYEIQYLIFGFLAPYRHYCMVTKFTDFIFW